MTTRADIRDDREEHLKSLLNERGMRCTTPRLQVVRILHQDGGHLTPDEISSRLDAQDGKHAPNLATVYRTLKALQDLGVVHPVAFPGNAVLFGLCDPPHHHAICIRCHRITPVDAGGLLDAVRRAERASRHQLAPTASLQLHGLCPGCQPPG